MEILRDLLGVGVEAKELNVLQVSARAAVLSLGALVIVRFGHKRFLAKLSAFDVILGFMLGSMLSRAVNGSGPLVPTMVAGLVLVVLHRIVSALSFHSDTVGNLVKGKEAVLARDGKLDWDEMRKHRITEKDLLEEARLQGKIERVDQIKRATLERSGKVSVVPKDS